MNLTEFVGKNNVKRKDGEEFDHSPEFFKIRVFERTCHLIQGVLFLEPETYKVKEFDVVLRSLVHERWNKKENKAKRQFFVNRCFRYPDLPDDIDVIKDAVPAGENIDEAIEILEAERQHFEFLKRYDLIDTGRYWLNRNLKRCLVGEGRVIVID